MSGSWHLDKASNVKIGLEFQIFVIVIFFNCGQILQYGTHSRYYKGALTQKRLFVSAEKNQNKHSTLNSSFNTLSKWHELDINPVK